MRSHLFLSICFCFLPLTANAAAIHDAAKKGDVAAIAAALEGGANVNDADGSAPPLYHAVRRGHLDAAKLLIERGADVNLGDKSLGVTPLAVAVAKDKIEFIELLLAGGADPNASLQGETALHVAAKHGCLACVKALVQAGADVNVRTTDEHHRTPVHLAKLFGFNEVADHLMAHGVVLPRPAPILAKLAAGDAEKGQVYFNARCATCHFNEPGKGRKMGPNLWGVVGSPKAAQNDAAYSKALRAWGGLWTYEDLNAFLYGPTLTTPGTSMEVRGVPDENERINLIAYLRTLSEKKPPLP